MRPITGMQSAERILSAYTAKAREQAPAPREESLVEQLAPPVGEPAAELAAEAGEIVSEEPAAEVELSDEIKNMGADLEQLKRELESAKQQGEAMAEGMESMGEILAIFRRIARGDRVPPQDEQKLMEYDAELYNAAKQLGAAAENEDPKDHESVDSEEEWQESMEKKIQAMAADIPEMPDVSASTAQSAPSSGAVSVNVTV